MAIINIKFEWDSANKHKSLLKHGITNQEAETTFQKASALRPDSWLGYNDLGLFYDRQNKYQESITALRKAAELTPDNAQVYLNLGAVYIDTGDAKMAADAEQALKKSIELAPSYPAYANLGQLYYTESVTLIPHL